VVDQNLRSFVFCCDFYCLLSLFCITVIMGLKPVAELTTAATTTNTLYKPVLIVCSVAIDFLFNCTSTSFMLGRK